MGPTGSGPRKVGDHQTMFQVQAKYILRRGGRGGLNESLPFRGVEGGRKPFDDVLMATERECCDCT